MPRKNNRTWRSRTHLAAPSLEQLPIPQSLQFADQVNAAVVNNEPLSNNSQPSVASSFDSMSISIDNDADAAESEAPNDNVHSAAAAFLNTTRSVVKRMPSVSFPNIPIANAMTIDEACYRVGQSIFFSGGETTKERVWEMMDDVRQKKIEPASSLNASNARTKEIITRYVGRATVLFYCPEGNCPEPSKQELEPLPTTTASAKCNHCNTLYTRYSQWGKIVSISIANVIKKLMEDSVLGRIMLNYAFEINQLADDEWMMEDDKYEIMADKINGSRYAAATAAHRNKAEAKFPILIDMSSDDSRAKGSRQIIWTCTFQFVDLPDYIRRNFVVLCAYCVYIEGKHIKPPMSVALKNVVNELTTVCSELVTYTVGARQIESSIFLARYKGDLKKRNIVAGIPGATGFWNCVFCKQKNYKNGRLGAGPSRTNAEFAEIGTFGHQEVSPLQQLTYFDMSKDIVIDVMHLFGGVFKDLTHHAAEKDSKRKSHNLQGPVLDGHMRIYALTMQKKLPVPHCLVHMAHFDNLSKFMTKDYWCFFLTSFVMALEKLELEMLPDTNDMRRDISLLPSYKKMIGALHLTALLVCSSNAYSYVTDIERCVKEFQENLYLIMGNGFASINYHIFVHLAEQIKQHGLPMMLSQFFVELFFGEIRKVITGSNQQMASLTNKMGFLFHVHPLTGQLTHVRMNKGGQFGSEISPDILENMKQCMDDELSKSGYNENHHVRSYHTWVSYNGLKTDCSLRPGTNLPSVFSKVVVAKNGVWFVVAACVRIVDCRIAGKGDEFIPPVLIVEEIARDDMDWSPLPIPSNCDRETKHRFYMHGHLSGKFTALSMDDVQCAAFTHEWEELKEIAEAVQVQGAAPAAASPAVDIKNCLKCIAIDISGIC